MVLKVFGSGSSGNCYILESSDSILMIECGLQATEVKKSLNFSLSKVVGCLVSHQHRDHSKCLKEMVSYGIDVYALADVFESHGFVGKPFCHEIKAMQAYKIGGFKVVGISLAHDVPCLGFIVDHEEMGKLLFVTDTMMLEYRIPKMNHILIEANYSDDTLARNIDSGIVPASMKDRLLHSHMELETTKGVLNANDLSECSEVVLIHLSGNNSDEERFIREVKEITGLPTYVAKKGLEIELIK